MIIVALRSLEVVHSRVSMQFLHSYTAMHHQASITDDESQIFICCCAGRSAASASLDPMILAVNRSYCETQQVSRVGRKLSDAGLSTL